MLIPPYEGAARRWPSVIQEESPHQTSALDFQPPELWGKNCLLFESPCLSYNILLWQSEQTNAEPKHRRSGNGWNNKVYLPSLTAATQKALGLAKDDEALLDTTGKEAWSKSWLRQSLEHLSSALSRIIVVILAHY